MYRKRIVGIEQFFIRLMLAVCRPQSHPINLSYIQVAMITYHQPSMFSSLLPKPKHTEYIAPKHIVRNKVRNQLVVSNTTTTIVENPNDGQNTITKLHLNADNTINYGLTIASAHGRKAQATYEDTIPLKKRFPNLKHHFPRRDLGTDQNLQEVVKETQDVVNKLINQQLGVIEPKTDDATFINYHTNSIVNEDRGRTIQIREYKEDPMLPPKFKLRKNRHKEPSPPPPILKNTNSTETKLTKEDREKWRIPAAISNWKNNQGFTISLDKRMLAANGGSKEVEPDVNIQKFGTLSNALELAEREAREELKLRNERLIELAAKEKKENQLRLKELAEISRNERRRKHSFSGQVSDGHKRNKH